MDRTAARLARIGADPKDDEDLRQKKSLVVLLAVLILPVSLVWGASYLAFGSVVGVLPFIYFAISVASLVLFSKTRNFAPFLTVQLLDVLLMTTIGQMLSGGFLPSGGVGLWGMLAPLGALVFLEVRQAIGWFFGFLAAFVLLGIAGEVFFTDVDVPTWFTTTMLALNVVGTGAVAFTVLASFATQRNAALVALRAEQERSEALIRNVLPSSIAERLKAATGSIADHVESASILFADVVDFTPLAQRLSPAEVVGHPRSAVLPLRHARRAARAREDQDDRRLLHGSRGRSRSEPRSRAQGRTPGARHVGLDRVGDRRPGRARAEDRHQLRAGHRRRDRHEALPLRPLGRCREHGEPHGVQRDAR